MILKYASRYGVLEVEKFDSLDEAVQSAYWAFEYGSESVVSIEAVGERVYDVNDVRAMFRPLMEKSDQEFEERPTPQAEIWIRSPSGKEASFSCYADPIKAGQRVVELAKVLGDRVFLRPLGSQGERLFGWQLEAYQAKQWEQARVGR